MSPKVMDGIVREIEEELQQTPWLGLRQAAAYVGCCEATLRRLARGGVVRHGKMEGRYRFHKADLDEYLRDGGEDDDDEGERGGGRGRVWRRRK